MLGLEPAAEAAGLGVVGWLTVFVLIDDTLTIAEAITASTKQQPVAMPSVHEVTMLKKGPTQESRCCYRCYFDRYATVPSRNPS